MKGPAVRWRIIGTCFLATTVNYLDRQCLSVAAPAISREFHLSAQDYASIVTSFLIAYTIMQGLSGLLIDRLGTRRGMAWSAAWWSGAAMLHALASGTWSLRAFRFLLGMGEAGNWPAATKVVAEWFPACERGLAVAIFDSGSSLGGMVAPPAVAWITMRYGWRPAFLVTGSLGFLWLFLLWMRTYRRPEDHPRISKSELEMILAERQPQASTISALPWHVLLRRRETWGIVLGRSLTDCVWWFYVYWLAKYLSDRRGFSLAEIGMVAWIPFVTVDVGNLAGGWLSSHLLKRGWTLNAARKLVLVLGGLGMIAGIPAGMASSAATCLSLIALATLSYSAWGTMMLTLPSDLFPPSTVASVSGLSGTGAGLGGITFSWITGLVVDRVSYQPIFVAAGLLPIAAIVFVQILIPNIREFRDTLSGPLP